LRADLDLGGLSVTLDMTLIGDELAFLCEGLNLADAVAGCLLLRPAWTEAGGSELRVTSSSTSAIVPSPPKRMSRVRPSMTISIS